MATNYAVEKIMKNRYPNTMQHLQQLIMDLEKCAKSYGKKTLFGGDKFGPASIKCIKTIQTCAFALCEDHVLNDPELTPAAVDTIDVLLKQCEMVYTSWPLAFEFWRAIYPSWRVQLQQ